MFKYLLISLLIILIYSCSSCTYPYKAGDLFDLQCPIEIQLRSKIIRQYLDTLIQKKGYTVPEK
jgi:hypothetical protein